MRSQEIKLHKNRVSVFVRRNWTIVDHEKLTDDMTYRTIRREIMRPVYVGVEFDEEGKEKLVRMIYRDVYSFTVERFECDDDTKLEVYWEL